MTGIMHYNPLIRLFALAALGYIWGSRTEQETLTWVNKALNAFRGLQKQVGNDLCLKGFRFQIFTADILIDSVLEFCLIILCFSILFDS